MNLNVAVLGGGSWGTTVAHLTAHNAPTVLWARDSEVAAEIDGLHRNNRYLEGYELHDELRATDDLAGAVGSADLVVMGVPSQAFRDTLIQVRPAIRPWVPIISLSKGLEQGTNARMTEVIADELPGHPNGVMTGPNLAKEILAGYAAASVVATTEPHISRELQDVFATDLFRVYRNEDIVGSEVGGALKNVIAIASGMADGLGTGDNTRAAVITRGLNEIARLGQCMGGEPITFVGLAGMGDLMATCISQQSRNRYVGEQLGRGKTIDEIIIEMSQVAEGVKTSKVVMELAAEYDCAMPIAEQVYRVCHEDLSAKEAYQGLLSRRVGNEMYGLDGR